MHRGRTRLSRVGQSRAIGDAYGSVVFVPNFRVTATNFRRMVRNGYRCSDDNMYRVYQDEYVVSWSHDIQGELFYWFEVTYYMKWKKGSDQQGGYMM